MKKIILFVIFIFLFANGLSAKEIVEKCDGKVSVIKFDNGTFLNFQLGLFLGERSVTGAFGDLPQVDEFCNYLVPKESIDKLILI